MVPAEHLGYHWLTIHSNGFAHMDAYFVDNHPESITIRLPGRTVVL